MMKSYITILVIGSCILSSFALPVTKKSEETNSLNSPDSKLELPYERYLRQIFDTLETDPEFREKLDKASEDDIRNGKIAQELDLVNHRVRTKLDELKRIEIQRLNKLAKMQTEKEMNLHLDHTNQHTFESEDLKKLIQKVAEDFPKLDKKRHEEFKNYEMEKQFQKEKEEHLKKTEENPKQVKEKHKKHEKVHHPGNKAQLEEVWEKVDHMESQDFNPRPFFMLHDVDSNGFWDETEVKALFIKELDKVYQSGVPENDMVERAEEMERMREHVFKEIDTNRDGLISYEEFEEQTKRDEYKIDPEWQTIDEQPQYTREEYLEFQQKRKEEGSLPSHPNNPQGYYAYDANAAYQTGQQHPPGIQQDPQQQHVQQQQYNQQEQQYNQQQQQYNQQQQQHNQQQQQYQQHQQNPQYQYKNPQQHQFQAQQVHLNSNQMHQQPQQVINTLSPQQHYQPIVNNHVPEQPVVSNSVPQQPPAAGNNISQQQQPINKALPEQSNYNEQQQQNIPQKH